MNNVRNIFIVSVALLTSAFVTSCRETNDWGDSEYSSPTGRMFSVTGSKITVTAEDTQAEVTFTAVPDASHYIIEISRDSLYDDIQLGGTATSVIFGQDKSITKSPAKLTNLAGDTRYFLRLKAMSDSRTESKWSYYQKSNVVTTFKTKSEQIFQEPVASDRDENKIRVSWDATKEVTNILVLDGNDNEIQNITLDAAAKAAGEYTVTGLTPSTTYIFKIMNGTDLRGTLKIATTAAMPAADFKYTLADDVTEITSTLLADIATQAQAVATNPSSYSATIGIPAGKTYKVCGYSETDGSEADLKIPDGMSVTFFGMSGGEAPVLNWVKCLNMAGSHAFIHFENVKCIDGGAQYFINQGNAATVTSLEFENCVFENFARSIFRLKDGVASTVNDIKVNNCIFTDCGQSYQFFYFNNAAYTVENIQITNSTFDTAGHSFIDPDKCTALKSVVIRSCTFYNVIGPARYLVNANGLNVDITLDKCLFGKTNSDTARGIRTAGNKTITDVYLSSDFILASNAFEGDRGEEKVSADNLYKDPSNHDFTVKISSLDALGDPRWFPTEE